MNTPRKPSHDQVTKTKTILLNFCKIKFKCELEMKQLKLPHDNKLNDLMHELKLCTISPKKVSSARVIYEKSKKYDGFFKP